MERPESFARDHQLQDLYLLVYSQRERRDIPRVDSVRCTQSSGFSLELKLLRRHPGTQASLEVAIVLAVRLPDGFPNEPPMIACVSGGEALPESLSTEGQLSLPWLRSGWPRMYTLSGLVKDICSYLRNPEPAVLPFFPASRNQLRSPSSPLLLPEDSPPERLTPSAPTLCDDIERRDGSLTFKCKWRSTRCEFQAKPPVSLSDLEALLRHQIPSLEGQKHIQLVEFNSLRGNTALTETNHWQRILRSGPSTVFILIEDLSTSSDNTDVDLLGLHDDKASQSPVQHRILEPPTRSILWTDIEVGNVIGIGSSCRVYKASWRGTDVAVKVFTGTIRATVEREFSNEVSTMTRLGAHPSLVLLIATTLQPLSLVFEYLPFSLFELINGVEDTNRKIPAFPSSWTKRVSMMLDIAKGLQFLHSFDVIHRDMKSLNLLVTQEGRVKLADFGTSRVAQRNSVMTGCCGTFQWMAPEVLQSAAYSLSADIYSFGIIMWEICEVTAPYRDIPPAMVPVMVLRDKKRPLFTPRTPEPLQQLIRQCWQEDPSTRPSAALIAMTLSSFFHRE